MNCGWTICSIDTPCNHVLLHWVAFEVNPTGPCYLPRPGPRFHIFAGQVEKTGRITATAEITKFDPARMVGQSIFGETYKLGPEAGFTAEMQAWRSRHHWLRMAGSVDKTAEVLKLSAIQTASLSEEPLIKTQGRGP
jgi:hypothetical protein